MKQFKIHIKGTDGTDWGLKVITDMSWNNLGQLVLIRVDFVGGCNDLMEMIDENCTGDFRNYFGNLFGRILFE